MEVRLYSSVFIINKSQEILLVKEGKKKNFGLWNLPGGHVDPKEDITRAAIREAKEETGLDVCLSHLLCIFTRTDGESIHFVFLSTEYTGEIKILDSNILDTRWVKTEALLDNKLDLLHPWKFSELLYNYQNAKLTDINTIKICQN